MPRAFAAEMASKMTAAGVAGFLRDDGHVVALAPGLQLFARGGTEGVSGGQQDR